MSSTSSAHYGSSRCSVAPTGSSTNAERLKIDSWTIGKILNTNGPWSPIQMISGRVDFKLRSTDPDDVEYGYHEPDWVNPLSNVPFRVEQDANISIVDAESVDGRFPPSYATKGFLSNTNHLDMVVAPGVSLGEVHVTSAFRENTFHVARGQRNLLKSFPYERVLIEHKLDWMKNVKLAGRQTPPDLGVLWTDCARNLISLFDTFGKRSMNILLSIECWMQNRDNTILSLYLRDAPHSSYFEHMVRYMFPDNSFFPGAVLSGEAQCCLATSLCTDVALYLDHMSTLVEDVGKSVFDTLASRIFNINKFLDSSLGTAALKNKMVRLAYFSLRRIQSRKMQKFFVLIDEVLLLFHSLFSAPHTFPDTRHDLFLRRGLVHRVSYHQTWLAFFYFQRPFHSHVGMDRLLDVHRLAIRKLKRTYSYFILLLEKIRENFLLKYGRHLAAKDLITELLFAETGRFDLSLVGNNFSSYPPLDRNNHSADFLVNIVWPVPQPPFTETLPRLKWGITDGIHAIYLKGVLQEYEIGENDRFPGLDPTFIHLIPSSNARVGPPTAPLITSTNLVPYNREIEKLDAHLIHVYGVEKVEFEEHHQLLREIWEEGRKLDLTRLEAGAQANEDASHAAASSSTSSTTRSGSHKVRSPNTIDSASIAEEGSFKNPIMSDFIDLLDDDEFIENDDDDRPVALQNSLSSIKKHQDEEAYESSIHSMPVSTISMEIERTNKKKMMKSPLIYDPEEDDKAAKKQKSDPPPPAASSSRILCLVCNKPIQQQ